MAKGTNNTDVRKEIWLPQETIDSLTAQGKEKKLKVKKWIELVLIKQGKK